MISYDHNIIFVHIPKCAGSSIESFFIKNSKTACDLVPDCEVSADWCDFKLPCEGPQHYTISTIRSILCSRNQQNLYDEMFKFAVVRNPWSRMVSESIYLSNTFKADYDIKTLCKMDYVGNHRFDINQIDFISINNNIEMDYVVKFENLNQSLDLLAGRLSVDNVKLPHTNKSNHKHYTEYYDDETKQMVAERYAKDIEYFGYEFE